MTATIGVDIGGSKVAGGVVDDTGQVLSPTRRSTPHSSPSAVADAVAEIVTGLRGSYEVAAVGIGAAGFVDANRDTVLFAPNLAWRDESLRAEVVRRVGLPVVVENDANAAGWAEYRFGAGRGCAHLVCLTLGTGIGGGIVLGGQLYRGQFGIAGEPGHLRMVPDGRECGCGNRGCWEQYCSGAALVRALREMRARDGAEGSVGAEGGVGAELDGPGVTRAARKGDPDALEAFAVVGEWLGRGLADLAAVLDPACFVVGGGVAAAGEILLAPARRVYAETLTGRGHRPRADIRLAELGNAAGLIGAADLARHHIDT